jgi:hypothetical protein
VGCVQETLLVLAVVTTVGLVLLAVVICAYRTVFG